MNWNELKEFIERLSSEEREKSVIVIDDCNGSIQGVHNALLTEEGIYAYYDGLVLESHTVDLDEEDLKDLQENNYGYVKMGEPYLSVF